MNSKGNAEEDMQPIDNIPLSQYLESDETILHSALDDNQSFKSLVQAEETLINAIYSSSDSLLDRINNESYSSFLADVDFAKAEMKLRDRTNLPVPDYLLRYMEKNIEQPERKTSLVVRLSQAGIHLFESLKQGLDITPSLAISPGMRSAVAPTTSNDAGYVVFEEKIQNGQKFFYQLVRETPKEVFMSIKIDTPDLDDYRQVILRRDGRFILSNKINTEGIVNFSGLMEGSYSVEFLGNAANKMVDLYLIVD
ncbi:hypothetical protein [Leptospira sp. GIMC2001]|uniref:hypothetical protein n=1 Tax=Leptospira sp. GIMC2001 TaxID=1513297 RepID=UPI002349089B|nr:hypothetical protein [Leptospira sp. GIMC2001]WCL48413.1 hypothetical protein O4O04_14025 [Leptospira sp. GIMC2001]